MNALESVTTQCPYCGECIDLMADASAGSQAYIEDCPVCCRPIHVQLEVGEEGIRIEAHSENE